MSKCNVDFLKTDQNHHQPKNHMMNPKTLVIPILIAGCSFQFTFAQEQQDSPAPHDIAALTETRQSDAEPAEFSIEMVVIDNPRNPPDPMRQGLKTGQVNYKFAISKYEITTAQYVAFLNAIAKDDTHEVFKEGVTSAYSHSYNNERIVDPFILRSGEAGAYVYEVKPGYEDLPVWGVSWFDAARFVNWLHNGKPEGAQTNATTEDGAYPLRGRDSGVDIPRRPNAKFWLPSSDEWHKAAYHNPDLPKKNQYNLYATGSDEDPQDAEVEGLIVTNPGPNTIAKGSLRHPVPVGSCESKSAYGVHDMMGNVPEWTDSVIVNKHRGIRGGGVRNAVKKDELGAGNDPTSASMQGIRVAGKP